MEVFINSKIKTPYYKVRSFKKIQICSIIILLITSFSCAKKSESDNERLKSRIIIEEKIQLPPEILNPSAFKIDSSILLYESRRLIFSEINTTGVLINSIQVPTIDEPGGLNSITDVFKINNDSILFYDSRYHKVTLLNKENAIVNAWNLKEFDNTIARSSAGKIIYADIDKESNLNIELTGIQDFNTRASPYFFDQTKLVFRYNLTQKKVEGHFLNYPEKSPYRTSLFWNGILPSVIKHNDYYIVTFTFDNNVYIYDKNFQLKQTINGKSKRFPNGIGNKFGSNQIDNRALITRKLNGFGLSTRKPISLNGKTFFFRVYRAAIGTNNEYPDDMASFSKLGLKPEFWLQIYKLNSDGLFSKASYEINLSNQKIGNMIGSDHLNNVYFLAFDPQNENEVILRTNVNLE